MSDDNSPASVAIEKEKTRRRLISLGELVAVLAVLISALGLFNSWSERRQKDQERITSEQKAAAAERRATAAAGLLLRARPDKSGSRLDLSPAREEQVVQMQTLTFPAKLGISPVETSGDARIEASWFTGNLKKARRAAKRPDETTGDERLPVLIETVYVDGGETRRDRTLYDIGYAVREGGLFGGSQVELRGVSLVARKADAAALDARWRRQFGS